MEKNLYIDASHPNETRVVLKSEDNIEDYEYEGLKNTLIKNNIYQALNNNKLQEPKKISEFLISNLYCCIVLYISSI